MPLKHSSYACLTSCMYSQLRWPTLITKHQPFLNISIPQVDPMTGIGIPPSSIPPTPTTPASNLPSFPPHPLSGSGLGLGTSSSLGAVGSIGTIGTGLSQSIQKPSPQLGQLPLQSSAGNTSTIQSPGLGSSQNAFLQQLQQTGLGQSGLGQTLGQGGLSQGLGQSSLSQGLGQTGLGSSASDRLGVLSGLGGQKQPFGSSLIQPPPTQTQSQQFGGQRSQTDRLRQGGWQDYVTGQIKKV